MNEELEKNFLEEIKPLIDNYERYVGQEMPYSSMIEVNKYKQYTNDEEGKILQSIDEEIEKLVASKMAELTQAREKKIQEKQEEIYSKTQEFVDKSKEEVNKEIEEKNKQIQEKEEELKEYSKKILNIKDKIKKLQDGKVTFKDVDDKVYKAISEAETEKAEELKAESRAYSKMLNDYNGMKDELGQLEEKRDTFNKTYGEIDFTGENVIDDISKIIEKQRKKDLANEQKDNEQTIHNPRMSKTSDDIRVASLEELERRTQSEEDEIKQDEEQKVKPVFPRIHVDEADEEKRKQEEEQMWEEYNKEQEEKKEQAKKEIGEKLEEHEQKLAKAREKHDKSEAKFYENLEKDKQEFKEEQEKKEEEEEKEIREKKEKFFNKKEKGYEDLLKEDLPYQALKERLINTYTLPQLGKAIGKKSLVEIYELYVKQVNKDLENTEIIEEGLTEEEMNEKLEEKLANEELKTTLSVRLEILKERQKEIKDRQEQERKAREQYNKREEQATKFFENIEKKYGIDLLPTVYLKDKTELISKYANGENTELLNNFKFLEYCEEQFKILEGIMNEQTVEQEEIDDYNDLQDQIQYIRAKALELGEIPPHIQEIKEKLVNLCKKEAEGYEDLLPSLYYDEKSEMIKESMDYYMGNPDEAKTFFERYKEIYEKKNIEKALTECRKIEKEFEKFGSYVKENKEIATDEEIYELRNAIQQIEKRKYIKENAYKETKIVVEPYNDRIMIYLKGEVEPRERENLAQLMEDGKNLYKSSSKNDGRNLKGSSKGIKKGNFAIIAALSKLGIEKKDDYIEGYSWMFDKNPSAVSKIDSIVYDFTNEDGKIQSKSMIKAMEKCAKDAEKYGVAESIGRKKGIIEKGTNGLKSFFGKGTEKVLALGEGIKNFHPIGNAIENRRAKKYSKDREVDISKTTSTYNEWRAKMDTSYEVWREKMGEGAPTLEDQAENARIFRDSSKQESKTAKFEHEKQGDYDIYSFYE